MPALPLESAGTYVAAAYVVFLALVFVYVAILGTRAARLERELAALAEIVESGPARERVGGGGPA
jgi:hypothetical protein